MNIAVIGAGVTGLASAAQLAAKGHQVTLFEKNNKIGGRMNQFTKDGFTFDMGPTIVMVPEVYKAVFEDCGQRFEDYVEMEQLRYIYDVYFDKDDKVRVPTDLAELHETLEQIEPGTTHGFMKFLTDIYKRYEVARKYFLERTYRKPSDFYNMTSLIQGYKLKTLNHADNLIGQYVDNEKIQKLLAFQMLYIGIDPKRGPSLYSIIPMIEMMFGVHFIKGGMYGMVKGLQKLNEDLGVDIQCNADIEEIIIDPKYKTADGVKVNGLVQRFDKVLCTADFPYAAQELMPKHAPIKKYPPQKIDKLDYSCSAFLMYIGIDKDITEDVLLHNVIFSNHFRQNIEEIFGGNISKDPSLYLYVPKVGDQSLAPEGQTGLYVLMPTPELKTGQLEWDNEDFINEVKDIIYRKLETIPTLESIKEHVISETIFTPEDFESKFNAKFGTAFGLMPTLSQSNYFRPPNVSKDYQDLYFAGASTHPGAGVPIVLTSAKITVDEILKDIDNQI
ncbi:4,4'-diapophytoene desaturase [Staphylococcus pasteuri]|uniref:4,4'-diapophytoene desaturase (4,4'-diaponeurosporene-forming) n=3 Tax=Staphylococcus TaxID=1279 RepID=A0ABY1H223_9STAP|nr:MULTISPECIES: phytoene desaturase family protein [Staphylococcus]ATH61769.1 dehydrosqualene desaturase [Staphylococcus pasteuri]MCF7599935.1 phytoene desaturase family protein [Staphylococcus pasteuri]MDI3231875.1 phytoene desaturase family protein [Staphylococcus pasteuri]MDO6572725.1 phytoene desaturase family protein [Staphylococcus pasteuri_A]MEB6209539.1 phytoene desaturase family protein [Staphylococcus pasteuri]